MQYFETFNFFQNFSKEITFINDTECYFFLIQYTFYYVKNITKKDLTLGNAYTCISPLLRIKVTSTNTFL